MINRSDSPVVFSFETDGKIIISGLGSSASLQPPLSGEYVLSGDKLFINLPVSESRMDKEAGGVTMAFKIKSRTSSSMELSPLDNFAFFVLGNKSNVSLQKSELDSREIEQKVNKKSEAQICMSNLKQLSVGMMIYASDYDDYLPKSVNWSDVVMPYIKNLEVFKCPTISNRDKKLYGISFMSSCLGINLPQVEEPAKQYMLFDSDDLKKNSIGNESKLPKPGRHNGNNHVSFLDAHVKAIRSN